MLGNATSIPITIREYTAVEKDFRLARAKGVVQAAKRYIADPKYPAVYLSDEELSKACIVLKDNGIDPDEV